MVTYLLIFISTFLKKKNMVDKADVEDTLQCGSKSATLKQDKVAVSKTAPVSTPLNVSYHSMPAKNNHIVPKLDGAVLNCKVSSPDCSTVLKRRDSFSSCSSDSAVYCSSRHADAHPQDDTQKKATVKCDNNKRLRNSSGSSTLSSASDSSSKEIVPAKVNGIITCLQQLHTKCSKDGFNVAQNIMVTTSMVNKQSSVTTTRSEVSTIVKEQSVSFTCNTVKEAPLEKRHNLRQHIRKKMCCNCDCGGGTSHTTVTVRRFTEIQQKTTTKHSPPHLKPIPKPKVVKEQKVLPKLSPVKEPIIQTPGIKDSPRSKLNRKRRTEVDKLYDALHEIKWAKHMSPDNILCPLDFRRSTSTSQYSCKSQSPAKSNSGSRLSEIRSVMSSSSHSSGTTYDEVEVIKVSPVVQECMTKKIENNECLSSSSLDSSVLHCNIVDPPTSIPNLISIDHFDSSTSKANDTFITQTSKLNGTENLESMSGSETKMDIMREFDEEVAKVISDLKEEVISQVEETQSNIPIGDHFTETRKSANDCPSMVALTKKSACAESCCSSDLLAYPNGLIFQETLLPIIKSEETDTKIDEQCIVINPQSTVVNAEAIDVCYEEEIVTREETDIHLNISHCDLPVLTKFSPVPEHSFGDIPPVLESCSLEPQTSNVADYTAESDNIMGGDINEIVSHRSIEGVAQLEPEKPDSFFESANDSEDQTKFSAETVSVKSQRTFNLNLQKPNRYIPSYNYIRSRKIVKKYRERLKARLRRDTTSHILASTSYSENTRTDLKNIELSEKGVPSCSEYRPGSDCDLFLQKGSHSNQELDFSDNSHTAHNNLVMKEDDKTDSSLDKQLVLKRSRKATLVQSPTFRIECLKALGRELVRKRRPPLSKDPDVDKVHVSGSKTKKQTSLDENKNVNTGPSLLQHVAFSCIFHYKGIVVSKNETYTQVTLKVTRGHRIYLSVETLNELKDTLNSANHDSSCKVLILNGVGNTFCSGLDLKPLLDSNKAIFSKELAEAVKDFIVAIASFRKPLVSVVNGSAMGLGVTLLAYSDIVIASDHAMLHMPYNLLGYSPEGAATLMLPQSIRSTVAMDMMLRGRVVTSTHACDLGLVSEVLPASRLPHELVSRVRMLAENNSSSLETIKAMLRMHLNARLNLTLESETVMLPEQWLSQTCQTALQKAYDSGFLV